MKSLDLSDKDIEILESALLDYAHALRDRELTNLSLEEGKWSSIADLLARLILFKRGTSDDL